MPVDLPDRAATSLRALLFLTITACTLYYVAISLHWPMLVDSPIMHYVNFLIDHGMKPYRDITDNNMPGAYLTERWAMTVFGGGDLGWRLYDLFLLGAITLSMVIITRPPESDWFAGFYAGGLFTLVHASEGPIFAAEREELLTLLLVASCALLFSSVRRRWPALAGLFGLLAAMAASIKPTVLPFPLLALAVLAFALRRRKISSLPYLGWAFGGMLVALAINLQFIVRYSAWQPLLFILKTVTPAYVTLNRPGLHFMLAHLAPPNLLLLALVAAPLFLLKPRWDWERLVLLLGALLGALSFFIQQKGFFHHRYMFLAFFLLLLCQEISRATRTPGWPRWIGAAGILLTLGLSIPHYIHLLNRVPTGSPLTRTLETDLQALGADRLQHEVQCFDLVYGCLNALYHLRLVENTGYTGDLLLFVPNRSAASDFYREKFWTLQKQRPASVFVITNEVFGKSTSFDKLLNWPEFVTYLNANYHLATARSFPSENHIAGAPLASDDPPAYRIYLRNGTLLPPAAPAILPPPR